MLPWLTAYFHRRRMKIRQGDLAPTLRKRFAVLLALIALHTLAMVAFEGLAWRDGLWLTLTTATTVGYGDFSAKTDLGRLSTISLLYIGAISQYALVAAEVGLFMQNRRELKRQGKWNWKMEHAIVVVGLPVIGTARYLGLLAAEIRCHPELADNPVVVLATEMPDEGVVKTLDDQSFFFNCGNPSNVADLALLNLASAKAVLVLCPDPNDPRADDLTAATLARLNAMGVTAPVLAEAALDGNRAFLKTMGAAAVTRATNDFPGLIVKAMTVPGSADVIEDVFSAGGTQLVDLPFTGQDGEPWAACSVRLAEQGFVLLGYVDGNGTTHRLGTPHITDAKHLVVLVPEQHSHL